jgi:hypothetical protein
MLRLGRKKEERTKQRRGAAIGGEARLFVADHAGDRTTIFGLLKQPASHGLFATGTKKGARRRPWFIPNRTGQAEACPGYRYIQ